MASAADPGRDVTMQPIDYALDALDIESIGVLTPESEFVSLSVGCEPSVARNEDGVSYRIALHLVIGDTPGAPPGAPYRIACRARCAFVSSGYSEKNDKWVLSEGLKTLYGLMSGSIAAVTALFQNGTFVPPAIDLSENGMRLLKKLSNSG